MPRVQLPGLKPTHKLVQAYYGALAQFDQHHVTRETAVRQPFLDLLRAAAGQRGWSLEPEYPMQGNRGNRIVVDAALRDAFWRVHGYWEAKDTDDDLEAEARRKFSQGYPDNNILFQAPNRALLFQSGQPALDADFTDPNRLVQVVNQFFAYTQPIHQKWDEAVADFQQQVPDLGRGLKQIIDAERKANPAFVAAFNDFAALCRASLNPNLRDEAVEEMLIQHLLTERLFRTVFKNPDFIRRNAIARQIETVLDALFSRSYSRDEYLGSLERFYRAIEDTAATITDFSTKQKFLNTVYEKFFQGFCVKVADTHGIVYTPPPKAIRWASERIGDEGVVAFVTNNGFIDGIACDGMRKHLAQEFDEIYTLDLTGNVRKNPKLSGTTHNVFGIQVGVSINFFVRKKGGQRPGRSSTRAPMSSGARSRNTTFSRPTRTSAR